MNAGYGHRRDEDGRLNVANGDLFYIRGLMGFMGEINIDRGNESFLQTENAIYSADGKTLCCITDKNIQSFTLLEAVDVIDVGAFFGCENLKSIIVGTSLREIRSFAFGYCVSLQAIKYSGSESEWNTVTKQKNWDAYAPGFIITCS